MAKKEYCCSYCDFNFTISVPAGYEVKFCPSCGEEIEKEECNNYEDDSGF